MVGVPRHVAIIMDGNRRWAQQHGLSVAEGHAKGVAAVQEAVQAAVLHGVEFLTLYAFSTENWNRSPEEVDALMELIGQAIATYGDRLLAQGVRVRVLGDISRLPRAVQLGIMEASAKCPQEHRLELLVALNYGARQELVRAARGLAQAVQAGALAVEAIDEAAFASHLYTAGVPDPELLIRTSGEQRLSNFLLWQLAYTELVFLPVLWPDFTQAHFAEALAAYRQRERRFGGTRR